METIILDWTWILLYIVGLGLLSLSMLWDIYLSFIPHLLLGIGAVLVFGWTWTGAAAFILPHLILFALMLVRGAIAEGALPYGDDAAGRDPLPPEDLAPNDPPPPPASD